MSDYLEDLVQNIYTNCDMSGFDAYNKGVQSLKHTMADFNVNNIKSQKERLKLIEAENKMNIRLDNYKNVQSAKAQRQIEQENKKLSERNNILSRAARFLFAYFSLRTVKNIIDTGSRLQLVQKSIQGLTKDTQDWDFIQQQAFKTGTDIEVVAKGYRNFFSSANMAGFGKENIQNMYADVLLSVRAIGASTQQTEGALLALEQMLSKGKVSMEELRRQLGNAIPGAFEIGAKAMNMTTMQFNEFVKTGSLASAEFVPKFVAQLKKEYAGGFKEISETVDFATTNLKNAWKMLAFEIVRGQTGREIARVLNSLTKILTSPTFINAIKIISSTLAKIVGFLRIIIEHIRVLMPLIAPAVLIGSALGFVKIAEGLVQVIKAVAGVKVAVGALNVQIVTLYASLLGTIGLFLVLEDILKGGHFRRLFNQGKDIMEMNTNMKKESSPGYFQKGNKVVFFDEAGNMFQMPYSGNMQKDYGGWRWDSDVMRSYRKNWIDTGQAKQIVPYMRKDGTSGTIELNKDNTWSISFGDINITSPSNDANTIGLAVQNSLVSLFTGQNLLNNPRSIISSSM